jgi:multidrug efflux pump subunit AcrB
VPVPLAAVVSHGSHPTPLAVNHQGQFPAVTVSFNLPLGVSLGQAVEAVDAAVAIQEACMVRFRPIMMTTMAALVGTLPIAIGWGAGAEARRPLGLAVVGGLLVSQTLTLYVTPVFYIYMEHARERFARRRANRRSLFGGVPAPAIRK